MIVVRLIGGLGNQLFQYSTGRRLAELTGRPLKLDITGFETYKLHAYALTHFHVEEAFATDAEIGRLKPIRRYSGPLASIIRPVVERRFERTWIQERRPYAFDPQTLETAGPAYLDGYWQNHKYFEPVDELLRRELSVKTPPGAETQAVMALIASVEAVAVHIRRGDYASDPRTLSLHGIAPLAYYETAASRIADRVGSPHFFVFSDDPDWAAAHLRLGHPTTVVSHNTAARNYDDLRLMALCRHHIIANSSFSWWGAWLGRTQGQMVFAPAAWLNRTDVNTSDATPPDWVRL